MEGKPAGVDSHLLGDSWLAAVGGRQIAQQGNRVAGRGNRVAGLGNRVAGRGSLAAGRGIVAWDSLLLHRPLGKVADSQSSLRFAGGEGGERGGSRADN